MGLSTGKSLVETDLIETAGMILKKATERGVRIFLPIDGITAKEVEATAATAVFPVQEIPADQMILDIGPATSLLYAEALQNAKTVVWNGPMGVFEIPAFAEGTRVVAEAMASTTAFTVVGGGDSAAAIRALGIDETRFSHISTGGGASLELLEGRVLPGLAVLEEGSA
jgi:phosphoglycerate kinase